MTTAVSKLATPALVSVFDNEKRCCVGFVLARGRSGFETGVIPMNALVKIVPDPKQLIRGDRLKFVDAGASVVAIRTGRNQHRRAELRRWCCVPDRRAATHGFGQ